MYDAIGTIMRQYIAEREDSRKYGSGDVWDVERQMRRTIRELNQAVKAVQILEAYGLTVC